MVQEHFDRLAPVYDHKKGSVYYKVIEKIVKRHLPSDIHVLDVGCGSGRLLRDIFMTGVGVDISMKLLAFARNHSENHEFIQADVKHLPFKDRVFEGVTCIDLMEHVDDAETVIKEITRVVKADGKVLLNTVDAIYARIIPILERTGLHLPEGPSKWKSLKSLLRLMSKDFDCTVEKRMLRFIEMIIATRKA